MSDELDFLPLNETMKIFDDLACRGLIKQSTGMDQVRQMLDGEIPCHFYLGIDPTADSLHIGHLLPLITALRLQQAGHQPVLLLGDATARIGDPSGKSSARSVLPAECIYQNTLSIKRQIKSLLGEETLFKSNNEWLSQIDFLTMMSEVGAHFSVNNMLRAECFKSRMEHGLSFLEFSYMLMQAFDFFWLHQILGVNLQLGGDDQWSNMLAGIDLIHKKTGHHTLAFTIPLLVNSDGTKMGKTEKGAVWLDAKKTSHFDFFQFWRNIPDDQVLGCLKKFTFLSLDEIATIPFGSSSEINVAKKTLAFEITKIVHGEKAAQATLEKAEALFESRDASHSETISIEEGDQILDLLVKCQLAKSRTDARHLIAGRGITLNGEVLTDPTMTLTHSQFGNSLVLCKGKKHFRHLLFTKDNNGQT